MATSPRRRHSWKSAFVKSFETSSFVPRSFTSSIPSRRPLPRTSPISGCRSCIACSLSSIFRPTRSAFSTRFSRVMISSDASPAADASGLPP